MRFLSKHAGFTIPCIPPVEQPMPNGRLAVVDKGVTAEFRPLHITEYEYELALREFKWNGLPMEMDGRTDISPRFRIGVYDTDLEARGRSWNEETKAIVEQRLLEACQNESVDAVQKAILSSNEFYGAGHPRDRSEYAAASEIGFEKVLIYAEPERVPLPWATYDTLFAGGPGRTKETIAQKIADLVTEIGADPALTLAYERANRNRPEVVELLEGLLPDAQPAEPADVVADMTVTS